MISGGAFDRPSLAALLDYARPGDTHTVIDLDRLGQSLKELPKTIDLLWELGVNLVSLEERIDTNSATGELVFHVFGMIAHFRTPVDFRANAGRAGCSKKAG